MNLEYVYKKNNNVKKGKVNITAKVSGVKHRGAK